MTVAHISTHADDAVDRLLEVYKQRPGIVGLVRALAGRAQVVEDQMQKLTVERLLYGNTAIGAQLDAVGSLVGIDRNGTTDAVYYVLILGTIAKNYSTGSTDTLVTIARDIFQASAAYISTPNSPGHVRNAAYGELNLAVADPSTDAELFPLVVSILLDSLSAGVNLQFIARYYGAGTFACQGPQPWVMGCSNKNGVGGGRCAGLLYR